MSKRVLSAFLVVTTVFLGLNIFLPALDFIKTTSAQATTNISNFTVESQNNYQDSPGGYFLRFTLGAALTTGNKINITFPSSFNMANSSVSSSNFEQAQLTRSGNTWTYAVPLSQALTFSSGNNLTVFIAVEKNPTANPAYKITVDTTTSVGAASANVTVSPPQQNNTENGNGAPSINCSIWSLGQCFNDAVTFIPKLIIWLLVKIIEFIIKGLIGALMQIGGVLLGFAISLNSSLSL